LARPFIPNTLFVTIATRLIFQRNLNNFINSRNKINLQELGSQNFFERNGKPFCEEDYHLLFSPRCAGCNGPILDKCISALVSFYSFFKYWNRLWHYKVIFLSPHNSNLKWRYDKNFRIKLGTLNILSALNATILLEKMAFMKKTTVHFVNAATMLPLHPNVQDANFLLWRGTFHHSTHSGIWVSPFFNLKCNSFNTLNQPGCFVCSKCQAPFPDGNFFEVDGKPYCENDFHALRGSLCAGFLPFYYFVFTNDNNC